MARKPLQLGRPDVAEIIDESQVRSGGRGDKSPPAGTTSGDRSGSGISVSQVPVGGGEGGLDSIWEKSGGGRPERVAQSIDAEVSEEFERRLEVNEFVTLSITDSAGEAALIDRQ